MKKVRTTFFQKICLLVFSFFLILIFIELGFANIIISAAQNSNRIIQKEAGNSEKNYRILTIGESTTAGSGLTWPFFLDKILNNKSTRRRFIVYNVGVAAVDSVYLVGKIEENIERYKPDMVISMMGVNDGHNYIYSGNTLNPIPGLTMKSSKTYRFLKIALEGIIRHLRYNWIRDHLSLKKLRENYSDDEAYRKLAMQFHYIDKKEDLAEYYLNKSFQVNNKSYRLYADLGWFYLEVKSDLEKAEEFFKESKKMNESYSNAYRGLGVIAHYRGELKKAEEFFKHALKLDPDNGMAYFELGWLYNNLGRINESEKLYLKAIELEPGNPVIYKGLGFIYYYHGNLRKAEPMYLKAAQLDPDDDDAFTQLGWLYRDLGNIKKSKKMFERAIDINPDNYRAAFTLVYLDDKKIDENFEKIFGIKTRFARGMTTYQMAGYHYNKMYDILKKHNITYIAMQYPTLKIDILKGFFNSSQDILYVSNEDKFKEGDYAEFFIDNFASKRDDDFPFKGNFGHTTAKGSEIIAKNAADAIIRHLNITEN